MEEILSNIEKIVTSMTVGVWFCFLCLAFLFINAFINEYFKNKEKEREELKEYIKKEINK